MAGVLINPQRGRDTLRCLKLDVVICPLISLRAAQFLLQFHASLTDIYAYGIGVSHIGKLKLFKMFRNEAESICKLYPVTTNSLFR